jgi:integrase
MARKTTGLRQRHSRTCKTQGARPCKCPWEASVYSKRDRKKIRKTFPDHAAAKSWRDDAAGAVRRRTLSAVPSVTLRQAAGEWLAGVKSGAIRTRSGELYKPSAIRSYEAALTNRILPRLGEARLAEIHRADVQDFAERLLADRLDPSTIRNTIMPLRAVYRHALSRGRVMVNPTTALELPAVRGRRDRIAAPDEGAQLLAALPASDRALWATAFYAGLRNGELRALRWQDVDLARGVIRVERSWDQKAGVIEPKSRAGTRTVPIAAVLRDYLDAHKISTGRDGDALVFGRKPSEPYNPKTVNGRAKAAWNTANRKEAEQAEAEGRKPSLLTPITLHECRHTFASLMIAAGVNAKALSTYLGHSSIQITLDRYGHLFPGNEEEAAGLLDAYLTRADTQARLAQLR